VQTSTRQLGGSKKPHSRIGIDAIRCMLAARGKSIGTAARFFDADGWLQELSAKGDALQRLADLVDFEIFRPCCRARRASCAASCRVVVPLISASRRIRAGPMKHMRPIRAPNEKQSFVVSIGGDKLSGRRSTG
jgi:hypothetical protein